VGHEILGVKGDPAVDGKVHDRALERRSLPDPDTVAGTTRQRNSSVKVLSYQMWRLNTWTDGQEGSMMPLALTLWVTWTRAIPQPSPRAYGGLLEAASRELKVDLIFQT